MALKGNRLAMVEVKQRRTVAEALEAVTIDQQNRLWQAGLSLQAKRKNLSRLDLNIDLYAIGPRAWPVHIKNAFIDMS